MRLAFHRFARGQSGGDKLLHGLLNFVGGNGHGFYFFDFGEHRVACGGEFVRVHNCAHAEKSCAARIVSPRVNVMDEALTLAHLLIQARAASAAEQNRKHVKNRNVGMAEFGNVPREMQMAEFDGRFLDDFARRSLFWFGGQIIWRQRAGFCFFVGGFYLRDDFIIFHVAGDDVEHVVRRVFFRVVIADVFRLQFVEDVGVADDGETIRAFRVGGLKQPPPGAARGIVVTHVHFAADDVKFLREFIRRQRRVLHDVAQNIYRRGRAGVRHVNVINRPVEARVGVHVTARFLHFLINARAGARRRALEEHMFEDVRKSRAEPAAFVDAARRAPRLSGDDGRAVIFAHDDDEAVVERGELDAGRQRRNFNGRIF